MPNHYHEITSIDELREMLQREERIERCAFQDMDFTALAEEGYTGGFRVVSFKRSSVRKNGRG